MEDDLFFDEISNLLEDLEINYVKRLCIYGGNYLLYRMRDGEYQYLHTFSSILEAKKTYNLFNCAYEDPINDNIRMIYCLKYKLWQIYEMQHGKYKFITNCKSRIEATNKLKIYSRKFLKDNLNEIVSNGNGRWDFIVDDKIIFSSFSILESVNMKRLYKKDSLLFFLIKDFLRWCDQRKKWLLISSNQVIDMFGEIDEAIESWKFFYQDPLSYNTYKLSKDSLKIYYCDIEQCWKLHNSYSMIGSYSTLEEAKSEKLRYCKNPVNFVEKNSSEIVPRKLIKII